MDIFRYHFEQLGANEDKTIAIIEYTLDRARAVANIIEEDCPDIKVGELITYDVMNTHPSVCPIPLSHLPNPAVWPGE